MTQATHRDRSISPDGDDDTLHHEQSLRGDAELLNAVALDLAAELDLQALVQKVTDAGTRLTGAKFGAFFYNMVDERGEAYQLYTLSGAPREAFEKFGMPRNTAVFAPTFEGGGVVRSDDITLDPRYGHSSPHHGMPRGHLPVKSYLAVPVASRGGEVLGGLFFGHPEAGVFNERAERLARGIAAQAAIAIDNARLYEQARREITERVKLQAAQHGSEQQLRTLVELMPAAMYAVDAEGRITHFNRRAVELWGREPKLHDDRERFCACFRVWSLDGRLIPPDQTPMAHAVRDGVSTRHAEAVVERPDGTRFIAQVNVDPIHDAAGRRMGAINVFQDITHRKRDEDAQANLAAIVTSSTDAILSLTLDGVLTSWNAGAQAIFGYTEDEVVGRSITTLIPPERHAEEDDILRRIVAGEHVQHFETQRLTKSGRLIDVSLTVSPVRDGAGRVVGVSKVARDITQRTRAEAALRDSERRLHMALAAGGMGTWEWTLATGRVAWSPGLEAIHGREPGSFGGDFDSVLADVHPDDRDRLIATVRRSVDTGEDYRVEYRILTVTGEERWLEARGTLIHDNDDGVPERMAGICMDVTARKQAEQEIGRLNEHLEDRLRDLQALLDVLPVGVFIAQDPDCRHITANRAGARMLRLPDHGNASKTGQDPLGFTVHRDGEPVAGPDLPMQRSCRTGETIDGEEYDVVFDDGAVTNLYEFVTPLRDERGRVRGCVGAFVDITERKRAEQALRDSEERFRRLAQQAPVGIFVTDPAGDCLFVNEAWRRMTGLNDDQARGGGWVGALHPDDRERVFAAWYEAARRRRPFAEEYRFVRPDGGVSWVEGSAISLHDADGDVTGYIGTTTDVTARRQAAALLEGSIDALTSHIAILDRRGTILKVNAAWRQFAEHNGFDGPGFGVGASYLEACRAHSALDHPCELEAQAAADGIEEVIAGRRDSFIIEYPCHSPSEHRWFIMRVTRFGQDEELRVVVSHEDVTQRHEDEQTIRESEEKFRTLADNMSQFAWMCDQTGWIFWYNQRWFDYTGTTLEQMQGWGWQAVHHPDHVEGVTARFKAAIDAGEPWEDTFPIRGKDGGYRWFLSRARPIRDARGGIVRWFGTNTDITDQRQAEAALRESQEKFSRFMQHLPGLAWIKDADGRYVFANHAAERAFGMSGDELYGKRDAELFPAPIAAQFTHNDREAVAGGRGVEVVETLEQSDGLHHSLVSKFPIPDPSGAGMLVGGMAIDITDRIKAEQALRDSEERFRQVAESLPQLVWTCDADGTCDYLSPQWVSYTGVPEAQQLGFAWLAQVHPDDRQRVIDHWKATAGQGKDYRVEFRIRRHDGEHRWFHTIAVPLRDPDGRIVKWFGSNTDIQDIKQAEQALRESEERFRVMADHAPVMVWVTDAQGLCTYLSKSWCEFTGQTQEEGLGHGWQQVVHPDDRRTIADTWERSQDHHKPFRMEYRLRRADGQYRWALDAAAPRFDADGRYVGYIGSVIDISDRKAAEQSLRRAKNELELRVAERTAELRALTQELTRTESRERKRLAQVLHDEVQQLLAAVKMQADFALMKPASADPIHRVKKLADDAIAACRALTVGLSPPVLRDADMVAALHWLSRHMHEQHGLNVQIFAQDSSIDLPEDLRVLMFEVTRELLFNVVKHAGVPNARINYTRLGDDVCIEVADDGKGCVPDALHRPGRDSFGLFSIRERLGALGGRIETLAAPRKGVRVRVVVPAKASHPLSPWPQDSPAPDPADEQSPALGVLRVLLADDHQMLRQGLAELLSTQQDIQVVAQASDGLEALELTRQYQPDVVVMDITMPKLSGVEATRAIRAEMPHVRVVGLSMHEHEDMAAAMRHAGAETFLNKAGPVDQLLAALRGQA